MKCFITDLKCGETTDIKNDRDGYHVECSVCLMDTGLFKTEREAVAKQDELLEKMRTVEVWRDDLKTGRSTVNG